MTAKKKIKLELFFLRLLGYLIFIALLLTFAILRHRVIEFAIIIIGYTFLRWCFPTTWHHKSVIMCIVYSIIFFMVLVELSLPIYISICSSVLIALCFTNLLYIFQSKLDTIEELKLEKVELEDSIHNLMCKIYTKDIYAMDEKELYEHCRSKGLSEEQCRVAYFIVNQRLKGKELYSAIGYSEAHSKRLRKAILDKIKN